MAQTPFDITVDGWGSHDYDDHATGILERDISPLMLEVLRRDPTFLGTIKVGKAATNRKVEWFERDWIPFQFTTNTNIPNDAAALDITVIEANMGKWLSSGTKLMLTGYATSGAYTYTPGSEFSGMDEPRISNCRPSAVMAALGASFECAVLP